MSLQAKYLQLRTFLEGIEIPTISATVQQSLNVASAAAIQVIPLDSLEQLKPKSMVHCFFYDFLDERNVDPTDYTRYKLLFTGEVIGYSYVKGALGRSAVLQCADLTNNWNRSYQYMLTYGPNGNFLTPEAANYAAGSSKFNNIVDGHLGVLGRWLNSKPKTLGLQNVSGLLGGIITLIEQFGGVVGHTRGVQDYFTVAELKNKTMQQITAEENDNTAQQLFDAKEFYEWLENGLVQLGELCSLWDMVRLLFQYIYYEYAPITSPRYISGSDPDKFEDTDKINKILEEVINSLYASPNFQVSDLLRVFNSIDNLKLVSEYQALSKTQETYINKAISYLQAIIDKNESFSKNIDLAKKEINKALTKIDAKKENIQLERLNSIVFKPECYFVAAPTCNVIFPEQNTQFSYSRNYEQEHTRLRLQSGMMFDIDKEKLFADFSYAPSGPEIRFIGQQQGEGPRLSAVLPWEKFTGVLPKFEFIQDINYIANKRQKELQKNVKTTTTKKGTDLQKTVQNLAKSYKQKAANFNFYKYRFMARQMSGSCRFNPMLVIGFPLVVINQPFIVDREKLINLAKEKNTDINKITQQDIIDNITNFAEVLGAPNQFIGYPTTISHMIGQDGATTSFSCTHARPHRITGDDFLQIYKGQVQESLGTVTSKTVLSADVLIRKQDYKNLKYLIDLTPQSPPQISSTKPDLPRPKVKVSAFDVIAPDFRADIKTSVGDYVGETQNADIGSGTIKVPVKYGTLQLGSTTVNGGTITAIRIVDDLIKKINFEAKDYYVWNTVIVYEQLENQKVFKPIPLEEVLKPSWFSPLYSNLLIGENIYGKFFGCGSVVDELIFKNQEGLAVQTKADNRFKLLDQMAKDGDSFKNTKDLYQKDLADPVSMESAIDILAFQYAEIINNSGDVNRFISDYTSRPIATMEDILGSADLQLTKVGNDIKVVTGKLGFHSVALSGFGDLAGLVSDPSLPLPSRRDKGTIPPAVDPRPERKAAVQKYYNELQINDDEAIGVKG